MIELGVENSYLAHDYKEHGDYYRVDDYVSGILLLICNHIKQVKDYMDYCREDYEFMV